MSRSAFRVPLLLLALLYGACTTPTAVAPAPSVPAVAATDVEALLGRMSLEQKVAQVMVIALEGTTFDAEAREWSRNTRWVASSSSPATSSRRRRSRGSRTNCRRVRSPPAG